MATGLRPRTRDPRLPKSKSGTLSLSEPNVILPLDSPKYGNDAERINLSSGEHDLGNSDGSLGYAHNETPVLKRPRPGSA